MPCYHCYVPRRLKSNFKVDIHAMALPVPTMQAEVISSAIPDILENTVSKWDLQKDSQPKTSVGQDVYDETTQNGNNPRSSRNGVPRTPSQLALNQTMPVMSVPAVGVPGGVVGPTTNLNIGMDHWATTPSPIPPIRAKGPATAVGGAMVPSEMCMQAKKMESTMPANDAEIISDTIHECLDNIVSNKDLEKEVITINSKILVHDAELKS